MTTNTYSEPTTPDILYHRSFVVSQKALVVLLINKATALQICGYLTLSCFTSMVHGRCNATGSHNALVNRLGIGIATAKTLVQDLCGMEYNGYRLLLIPEYDDITVASSNKYKHSLVRWELPCASSTGLWFHTDLVGAGRSPNRPLNKLWRICGDIATKLYLLMFYNFYLEPGLVSLKLLSHSFVLDQLSKKNGIVLFKATKLGSTPYIADSVIMALYGEESLENQAVKSTCCAKIVEALKSLELQGFIHRCVLATIRDENEESEPICYNLDYKGSNKGKLKGKSWCSDISAAAMELGFRLRRNDHKFYNQYFAIAPSGKSVHVSMAYRLKYSVTNPHNYRVDKAARNTAEGGEAVQKWITCILATTIPE